MSASYSKLKSGEWGVRVQGTAKPGANCLVTLKNGKTKTETLDRLIWEGDGVQLYAIKRGPTPEDTQQVHNQDIIIDDPF